MRVYGVALLTAAVAVVSTSSEAALVDFKIVVSDSAPLRTESGHFRRLLRTADDDTEERVGGLSASALEKAKTVFTASEVSENTLKRWLKKGKSLDDVFTRMRLTQAGDKLFETPQFFTWLKYADNLQATPSGKATSTIATLTAQYGDEALLKMIQAAAKVDKTKQTAVTLEAAQVQSWFTAGKSVDDVFTMLKLNHAGDKILTNPAFNTWNTYVQIFKRENPTTKTSLYATLAAHYSDDALFKIAERAKGVKSTAMVAKNLEATHIQKLLSGGKTPEEVFVLLKLDEAGDDLLASPQLNTFTKYMKNFNTENPDKQTSLIAAMTTSYGDNKLFNVLDAAKKVPSTEKMATNLETSQYQHWLSSGKGPDKVFKALNLDKAGDNLLSSPQFATFTKYTDDFYAKNPGKEMTTMWTIRASYSDVDVAKMIMAAEKVPATQNAAARMEGDLFKSWMAPPNNPDDVFRMLKLDTAGDALFANPMLSYWLKFLDDYNKVQPGKNIERSVLTTTYEGNEQALVNMIAAAKKDPGTKTLAGKLEAEMLTQFLYDQKQPLAVATLLEVKKGDANWKIWKKYLQDFNKLHLRGITT
ncbi:hypothetical protein PHYPSEUDO_002773 [Phytophthora pseudosyringae]|uniref:RxLR effector PexRD54 WY domain-containing protein n=1 Tax=Phytophthora pseudosyringae TaxID=221518 RepID=A0A8T1VVP7_9STRA|nr:hypothetical protein PHYPSEUDO_002773 [Phytophthora pseudosyringae]